MSERNRLLATIASTIADYRAGEIPQPTPAHVERWVNQFAPPTQGPILAEMAHVLGKTYLTKTVFTDFISKLITNSKIAGSDPCAFWRGVKFLDIQGGGNSQHDMLQLSTPLCRHIVASQLRNAGVTSRQYSYILTMFFSPEIAF
jgi:hypothetical protein